jgi:hypothetical protein
MSWRQPRSDYIGRETEKLGRTYLAEEHGRKIYILFYFYKTYIKIIKYYIYTVDLNELTYLNQRIQIPP